MVDDPYQNTPVPEDIKNSLVEENFEDTPAPEEEDDYYPPMRASFQRCVIDPVPRHSHLASFGGQ